MQELHRCYLAQVILCDLGKRMDRSPFISLMVDSSWDVAIKEHWNLYVCLIDPQTHEAFNFLLKTAFMTGTKSENYLAAV